MNVTALGIMAGLGSVLLIAASIALEEAWKRTAKMLFLIGILHLLPPLIYLWVCVIGG